MFYAILFFLWMFTIIGYQLAISDMKKNFQKEIKETVDVTMQGMSDRIMGNSAQSYSGNEYYYLRGYNFENQGIAWSRIKEALYCRLLLHKLVKTDYAESTVEEVDNAFEVKNNRFAEKDITNERVKIEDAHSN